MNKLVSTLAAGLVVICLGAAAYWWVGHVGQAEASTVRFLPDDASTVDLGKAIYADNCAACHGINLEGQLNWRSPGPDGLLPAPPHDETGHTWHHSEELLFGLTKYGLAKMIGNPDQRSGMPAYEDVLTDQEIIAVLSYIKSTWPDEIRERHDQLDRQSRETTK